MKQLDPDATGNIQEHQFVTNVLKNYDEFELNEILTVDMIPKEVLENSEVPMNDPREEHRGATDNKRRAAVSFKESYNGPSRTGHNSRFESSEEYLDNRTLESVAKKAVNKDWEKLAIKLGFLEYDIQAFKLKNKGYNLETVCILLYRMISIDLSYLNLCTINNSKERKKIFYLLINYNPILYFLTYIFEKIIFKY
jgi:hypothetical protein